MPQTIPDHDDDLRITDSTSATEVVAFLHSRLTEPAVVGDAIVWNFNSHDLDARALLNADLDDAHYVVPYQVPGVWGFMVEVLPHPVVEATLLTYRTDERAYSEYDNYLAQVETDAVRAHLGEVMADA